MLDIVLSAQGEDMRVQDDISPKAANVISTQIGSLDYATNFGADLRYFLQSDLQFQNESFRAYLVDRLTQHGVNVVDVQNVISSLFETYNFEVGSTKNEGFIL
jgi:hypothetical protein